VAHILAFKRFKNCKYLLVNEGYLFTPYKNLLFSKLLTSFKFFHILTCLVDYHARGSHAVNKISYMTSSFVIFIFVYTILIINAIFPF
jgi:hypothetical protein